MHIPKRIGLGHFQRLGGGNLAIVSKHCLVPGHSLISGRVHRRLLRPSLIAPPTTTIRLRNTASQRGRTYQKLSRKGRLSERQITVHSKRRTIASSQCEAPYGPQIHQQLHTGSAGVQRRLPWLTESRSLSDPHAGKTKPVIDSDTIFQAALAGP